MKKREIKNKETCRKCKKVIGGQSYYIIQLDCIYDGKTLSACDRVMICSDCYHNLRSWLNMPI